MQASYGRYALLIGAVVGSLTACDDPNAAPPPTLQGRWALRTVDGSPLPFEFFASMSYVEYIDSAFIEIRRYSRLLDIRYMRRDFGLGGETFRVDTGVFVYQVSDTTLIIKRTGHIDSDDWADTGSWSPAELTVPVRRFVSGQPFQWDQWRYTPLAP